MVVKVGGIFPTFSFLFASKRLKTAPKVLDSGGPKNSSILYLINFPVKSSKGD